MTGRAAEGFLALAGSAPAGVWAAPGRVNLVGEHTDYNDGYVLPFAIDREAVVAVGLRPDDGVRVRSLQRRDGWEGRLAEVGPGRPAGWAAYVAGVAWALRAGGAAVGGFDLVVDSAVPLGGGLSSSAALEAATAAALRDLFGLPHDATALALACRRAENEVVGAVTGVMDQMTALHARADHALLVDCRSLAVESLPFAPRAHGLAVAVVDTRVRHDNAGGGYAVRRRECAAAAAALGVDALRDAPPAAVETLTDPVLRRRARHVVTENARVVDAAALLRGGDLLSVGPVLDASHASMRDDFDISCPEVEVAVDALRAAGALGARLTGGGFGGCVVGLVDAAGFDAAATTVRSAYADRGFAAPAVFRVAPSGGARRLA